MAGEEEISVLDSENHPLNDNPSVATYFTAVDNRQPRTSSFYRRVRVSRVAPEFFYSTEESVVLRERFPLRDGNSEDNEDDLDFDEENNEDAELPLPPVTVPELPDPPHHNIFREMKNDGEAAISAGVEFVQEATGKAQRIIQRVWKATWIQTPFHHLPDWLKDNDFLMAGHRPQIESFKECFRSIFRIHTETGNIWSHLLGCVAFIGVAVYFLMSSEFPLDEKLVFAAYFAGAIICMGFSFMFHTFFCHSRRVGLLFLKLDYCGIAILIFGSFVPWLHFGFYCRTTAKIVYLSVIGTLAVFAVVVALCDKFSKPHFRPVRAGVFLSLGLIGIVPAAHSLISVGWMRSTQEMSIHWLFFMGFLYVFGATMYAFRMPERFFPGRFDIWFQSHQIFHVFVVIAAFVHYHGISLMAVHRLQVGACPNLPAGLEAVTWM